MNVYTLIYLSGLLLAVFSNLIKFIYYFYKSNSSKASHLKGLNFSLDYSRGIFCHNKVNNSSFSNQLILSLLIYPLGSWIYILILTFKMYEKAQEIYFMPDEIKKFNYHLIKNRPRFAKYISGDLETLNNMQLFSKVYDIDVGSVVNDNCTGIISGFGYNINIPNKYFVDSVKTFFKFDGEDLYLKEADIWEKSNNLTLKVKLLSLSSDIENRFDLINTILENEIKELRDDCLKNIKRGEDFKETIRNSLGLGKKIDDYFSQYMSTTSNFPNEYFEQDFISSKQSKINEINKCLKCDYLDPIDYEWEKAGQFLKAWESSKKD